MKHVPSALFLCASAAIAGRPSASRAGFTRLEVNAQLVAGPNTLALTCELSPGASLDAFAPLSAAAAPSKGRTRVFTLALLARHVTMTKGYGTDLGNHTATVWQCVEWTLPDASWTGNPFDVVASATFVHAGTNERRTTGMFYVGGNRWKFRFTGTRAGEWRFTTATGVLDWARCPGGP